MIIDAQELFKKKKAAILLSKRTLPEKRKVRDYQDEVEVQRAVKAVAVEKQRIMEMKNVAT